MPPLFLSVASCDLTSVVKVCVLTCVHMVLVTLALLSSSSRVDPPPSVISNVSFVTRRRLFRKPKLTCSRKHSSVKGQVSAPRHETRRVMPHAITTETNRTAIEQRGERTAVQLHSWAERTDELMSARRSRRLFFAHVSPGKARWGSQTASRCRRQSGSSSPAGLWAWPKTPESNKRSQRDRERERKERMGSRFFFEQASNF